MKYNYLIFNTEIAEDLKTLTETLNITPAVCDLTARAKTISEVTDILSISNLQGTAVIILRYDQLNVGAIIRRSKNKSFEPYYMTNYPKKGSDDLLRDFMDQVNAKEIIFASLNMYNSIQLKDIPTAKLSYATLKQDKEMSVRILKNQLSVLHGVSTDIETLTGVLKLWWKTLKDDQEKHS